MRSSKKLTIFSLIACLLFALTLTSCGEEKSGSTIEEPEITGEYLAEEYAEQLLADGAETMLGAVTLEKNGDNYKVHIIEQEVVLNSNYDEGYYVADTNLTKDAVLGFDARIAILQDGALVAEAPDDFIANDTGDAQKFFTIYLMGDSAELILETDPASVEVE